MRPITQSELCVIHGGLNLTQYLAILTSVALTSMTTELAYEFGYRNGFDNQSIETLLSSNSNRPCKDLPQSDRPTGTTRDHSLKGQF